jgi:thioredoxin-like negative regulator of GroEL
MKLATFILLLLAAASFATDAVKNARESIKQGIPQAAIAPLQEALRKAPAADKNNIGLLLARAQLAAGRPADALKTLDSACERGTTDESTLRASAFAAQGSLEEAARLLAPLADNHQEARLLLARVRAEQGDLKAARAVIDAGETSTDPAIARLLLDLQLSAGSTTEAAELIESLSSLPVLPESERNIALGRLALGEDRAAEAAELFTQALATPDISAPLRDNARLGLARAQIALGNSSRAREVLRESLASTPDAFLTGSMMSEWLTLEQQLGGDPSADLRKWSEEKPGRRTIEAALALARLNLQQRRVEIAVVALERLLQQPAMSADDALRTRLLLAEAKLAAGQNQASLDLLEALPGIPEDQPNAFRYQDLRGRSLSALGAHRRAHDAFTAAGLLAKSPAETEAAATNALVSALAAGDLTLARAALENLHSVAPQSAELPRWTFLFATATARQGDPSDLSTLARNSPSIDYSFQAKLALAEWQLARGDAAAASSTLETARPQADNETRAASLAAAEIFTADASGSRPREELITAATSFLSRHPGAPETFDVRFKLAELHARGGDHAAAESLLSELARSASDPATATLAKFLAAQAASRSMSAEGRDRALTMFDEIAQTDTPIRHRARFEQASLLLRERRFKDALVLYDRLITGDAPAEIRHAAIMEKGDTLFASAAESPDQYVAAAEVYATLAADLSAPSEWRDQAACKQAAAMARSGQIESALAVYREVLSRPPGRQADQYWFFKAGLEAGRLLEEQEDWPAAIAVYDQLASAGGPQGEEIKQRARRLRLEHFIWEN